MEQDLIRERYDLSMARIQEILTEETVPENYRDYFRKVTEFIIQCGEVLKAKEDGSLDQMTLEEGRTLNHKLYVDVLPENYETSYTNPAYAGGGVWKASFLSLCGDPRGYHLRV